MKSSRLNLIIALVLAVAAGFSVWMYTSGAKTAVQSTEQVVKVVVAKKVIPVGTSLADAVSQGYVESNTYPKASLPTGYITTEVANDTAQSKLLVTQVSVPAGAILGSNYLVPVSEQKPNVGPLQVPAGMFAVSVTTPDSDHVGTFVVPGVDVAVFCTYTELSGNTTQNSAQSASALRTRLLVPEATVIAVGNATSVAASNANAAANKNSGGLITLAANQSNSQKIIQCTRDGQVYLALLGTDTKATPDDGVSTDNLFKN